MLSSATRRINDFFHTKSRDASKNRIVLVTAPSSYSPIIFRPLSTHFRTTFKLTTPIIENPQIPLGPAYIAACLEQAGYDVRIVDLTFTIQRKLDIRKAERAIFDLEPKMVGISSFTSTIPTAFKLATAIKEEDKDVLVAIGGPHVSALPRRTLKECPDIDLAVIGEGEHVLREFLDSLHSKVLNSEMIDIRGIMFRHNGKILGSPVPAYVEDLDLLPLPARHLFNMNEYVKYSYYSGGKNHPVASMITSRGCVHSCLFCSRSNSGNRFRSRSPENIISEIEQLKKYGFKEIQFVDDDFASDRKRVLEICRLIKERKIDMTFCLVGGARVDSVDRELLSAMYNAGFYSIYFGAESGDDAVLKAVRKGITVEQIRKAVQMAKEIGYQVTMYVIVGLPNSTVESEKKTLQLTRELKVIARASVCTPYPGSPLWNMFEESLQGVSWERYNESDITNSIYLSSCLTNDKLQVWMNEVESRSEGEKEIF